MPGAGQDRCVRLTGLAPALDLKKTFTCGQCFRWTETPDGAWTGIARGRVLRLFQDGEDIVLCCSRDEYETLWHDYFDLELDYAAVARAVSIDPYMCRAAAFGAGIRILRQEPWEALCSFILSQCSNIPRIRQMVSSLCALAGRTVQTEDGTAYAFPTPEAVAALSPEQLAPVRAGYRAGYVLSAARAVAEGHLDLEQLARCEYETARSALMALPGVGRKVADCAVLFGLHMLGAFPVDVWVRRALHEHYGKDFDPAVFNPYGGIAQQYMFYYARCGGKESE